MFTIGLQYSFSAFEQITNNNKKQNQLLNFDTKK